MGLSSGFEDGEHLTLSHDVVEIDENRDLSFPAAGAATGISIFIASTNTMSSPSPTLPPISTGSAQTRPATSVTILMSGIPFSGTAFARMAIEIRANIKMRANRRAGALGLWPQIA